MSSLNYSSTSLLDCMFLSLIRKDVKGSNLTNNNNNNKLIIVMIYPSVLFNIINTTTNNNSIKAGVLNRNPNPNV